MRRPPVPPDEPTGLNQERPGQSTEARFDGRGYDREGVPSWKPHPGDGQAVSMVNTCEPVIKIVMASKPKWLSFGKQAWAKMASGSERGFNGAAPLDKAPAGRQRVPNLTHASTAERGNPVHFPQAPRLDARLCNETEVSASGTAVRWSDRCAGLRCRKKRMPCCNGADTGCHMTGRESEPTSDWSFIARESEKPPAGENADDGCPQGTWCALRFRKEAGWPQARIAKAEGRTTPSAGSCDSGSTKGLSRMKGNFHVRFLGEPGPARAPGLPGGRQRNTRSASTNLFQGGF